jgi:hypothetical protein
VRQQLFVLANKLGNFLRQTVLPQSVRHWTLTTQWSGQTLTKRLTRVVG